LPLFAGHTTSVKAPATNADPHCDDGPDDLVGDEINAKGVDDGVSEGMPAFSYLIDILLTFITQSLCLADSTTSMKETAPSQVAVGAADSTVTSKEIAPSDPSQVTIGAADPTVMSQEITPSDPSQVTIGAADSTAMPNEVAPSDPSQVAVSAAHSEMTRDGAAAAENRADETRADTVNMPVFAGVPAVPAYKDEATKKRPAAGDIF
jgi:hypothetical protein